MKDSRFLSCAGACVRRGRKRAQEAQAPGRSRGGFSTKIHLKTDKEGHPIGFHLTGGEVSDGKNFETLLDIGLGFPVSLIKPVFGLGELIRNSDDPFWPKPLVFAVAIILPAARG